MEFRKKVLGNGITLLFEKRDVPVTTVMCAARFGSLFETQKTKGVAHFIEHMCFKGTKKRSAEDISSAIEKVGGVLNAFTHEEVTAYHAKIPSDKALLALDVLLDVFFNAEFPEEEIKKECQVICEEIKMYKDNPRMRIFDGIKRAIYKPPFGMSIAGTEESVKSLLRDDLFRQHRAAYVPENTVICVVGNNSFEEIEPFILNFVNFSGNSLLKGKDSPVLEKKGNVIEEKRDGISQANIAMGFDLGNIRYSNRHAVEVFSSILGEGMSSRLFREVREKRGLVYSVKSQYDIGGNYAYFFISAGTDPLKVEEVYEICEKEFFKMANVTEEEVLEAKERLKGERRVHDEDSNHSATELVFEEIAGNLENSEDYFLKLDKVSAEDVRAITKDAVFSKFSVIPRY